MPLLMLQAARARLGYTRALRKLGKFAEALKQLKYIRKSARTLPPKLAKSIAGPLAIQEAATYACVGRLSEAIAAQQDVLLAMDAVLSQPASKEAERFVTEEKFAVACVELLRLLLWAGEQQREMARSVRQMAMQSGDWKDPRQVWRALSFFFFLFFLPTILFSLFFLFLYVCI